MRAMEADAQAYAASACEELHRLGDKGPKEEFFKYYPEISRGFSQALDKNNGKMGHDLLTATFKAWYDQSTTKSVYENGYLLEPMQRELDYIAKGYKIAKTFEKSISARQTIAEIAWTKNGNYFQDDPDILNSGKYLDVSEFTMEQMKKFFEFRKEMTGVDDSKALDGIPTRQNSRLSGLREIKKPVETQKTASIKRNKEAVKNQNLAKSFIYAQKIAAKHSR